MTPPPPLFHLSFPLLLRESAYHQHRLPLHRRRPLLHQHCYPSGAPWCGWSRSGGHLASEALDPALRRTVVAGAAGGGGRSDLTALLLRQHKRRWGVGGGGRRQRAVAGRRGGESLWMMMLSTAGAMSGSFEFAAGSEILAMMTPFDRFIKQAEVE